jgi:hypothetical protein
MGHLITFVVPLRQENGDSLYAEGSIASAHYVAVLTLHEVVTKIARTKTIPQDPYTDELPKWVRHTIFDVMNEIGCCSHHKV